MQISLLNYEDTIRIHTAKVNVFVLLLVFFFTLPTQFAYSQAQNSSGILRKKKRVSKSLLMKQQKSIIKSVELFSSLLQMMQSSSTSTYQSLTFQCSCADNNDCYVDCFLKRWLSRQLQLEAQNSLLHFSGSDEFLGAYLDKFFVNDNLAYLLGPKKGLSVSKFPGLRPAINVLAQQQSSLKRKCSNRFGKVKSYFCWKQNELTRKIRNYNLLVQSLQSLRRMGVTKLGWSRTYKLALAQEKRKAQGGLSWSIYKYQRIYEQYIRAAAEENFIKKGVQLHKPFEALISFFRATKKSTGGAKGSIKKSVKRKAKVLQSVFRKMVMNVHELHARLLSLYSLRLLGCYLKNPRGTSLSPSTQEGLSKEGCSTRISHSQAAYHLRILTQGLNTKRKETHQSTLGRIVRTQRLDADQELKAVMCQSGSIAIQYAPFFKLAVHWNRFRRDLLNWRTANRRKSGVIHPGFWGKIQVLKSRLITKLSLRQQANQLLALFNETKNSSLWFQYPYASKGQLVSLRSALEEWLKNPNKHETWVKLRHYMVVVNFVGNPHQLEAFASLYDKRVTEHLKDQRTWFCRKNIFQEKMKKIVEKTMLYRAILRKPLGKVDSVVCASVLEGNVSNRKLYTASNLWKCLRSRLSKQLVGRWRSHLSKKDVWFKTVRSTRAFFLRQGFRTEKQRFLLEKLDRAGLQLFLKYRYTQRKWLHLPYWTLQRVVRMIKRERSSSDILGLSFSRLVGVEVRRLRKYIQGQMLGPRAKPIRFLRTFSGLLRCFMERGVSPTKAIHWISQYKKTTRRSAREWKALTEQCMALSSIKLANKVVAKQVSKSQRTTLQNLSHLKSLLTSFVSARQFRWFSDSSGQNWTASLIRPYAFVNLSCQSGPNCIFQTSNSNRKVYLWRRPLCQLFGNGHRSSCNIFYWQLNSSQHFQSRLTQSLAKDVCKPGTTLKVNVWGNPAICISYTRPLIGRTNRKKPHITRFTFRLNNGLLLHDLMLTTKGTWSAPKKVSRLPRLWSTKWLKSVKLLLQKKYKGFVLPVFLSKPVFQGIRKTNEVFQARLAKGSLVLRLPVWTGSSGQLQPTSSARLRNGMSKDALESKSSTDIQTLLCDECLQLGYAEVSLPFRTLQPREIQRKDLKLSNNFEQYLFRRRLLPGALKYHASLVSHSDGEQAGQRTEATSIWQVRGPGLVPLTLYGKNKVLVRGQMDLSYLQKHLPFGWLLTKYKREFNFYIRNNKASLSVALWGRTFHIPINLNDRLTYRALFGKLWSLVLNSVSQRKLVWFLPGGSSSITMRAISKDRKRKLLLSFLTSKGRNEKSGFVLEFERRTGTMVAPWSSRVVQNPMLLSLKNNLLSFLKPISIKLANLPIQTGRLKWSKEDGYESVIQHLYVDKTPVATWSMSLRVGILRYTLHHKNIFQVYQNLVLKKSSKYKSKKVRIAAIRRVVFTALKLYACPKIYALRSLIFRTKEKCKDYNRLASNFRNITLSKGLFKKDSKTIQLSDLLLATGDVYIRGKKVGKVQLRNHRYNFLVDQTALLLLKEKRKLLFLNQLPLHKTLGGHSIVVPGIGALQLKGRYRQWQNVVIQSKARRELLQKVKGLKRIHFSYKIKVKSQPAHLDFAFSPVVRQEYLDGKIKVHATFDVLGRLVSVQSELNTEVFSWPKLFRKALDYSLVQLFPKAKIRWSMSCYSIVYPGLYSIQLCPKSMYPGTWTAWSISGVYLPFLNKLPPLCKVYEAGHSNHSVSKHSVSVKLRCLGKVVSLDVPTPFTRNRFLTTFAKSLNKLVLSRKFVFHKGLSFKQAFNSWDLREWGSLLRQNTSLSKVYWKRPDRLFLSFQGDLGGVHGLAASWSTSLILTFHNKRISSRVSWKLKRRKALIQTLKKQTIQLVRRNLQKYSIQSPFQFRWKRFSLKRFPVEWNIHLETYAQGLLLADVWVHPTGVQLRIDRQAVGSLVKRSIKAWVTKWNNQVMSGRQQCTLHTKGIRCAFPGVGVFLLKPIRSVPKSFQDFDFILQRTATDTSWLFSIKAIKLFDKGLYRTEKKWRFTVQLGLEKREFLVPFRKESLFLTIVRKLRTIPLRHSGWSTMVTLVPRKNSFGVQVSRKLLAGFKPKFSFSLNQYGKPDSLLRTKGHRRALLKLTANRIRSHSLNFGKHKSSYKRFVSWSSSYFRKRAVRKFLKAFGKKFGVTSSFDYRSILSSHPTLSWDVSWKSNKLARVSIKDKRISFSWNKGAFLTIAKQLKQSYLIALGKLFGPLVESLKETKSGFNLLIRGVGVLEVNLKGQTLKRLLALLKQDRSPWSGVTFRLRQSSWKSLKTSFPFLQSSQIRVKGLKPLRLEFSVRSNLGDRGPIDLKFVLPPTKLDLKNRLQQILRKSAFSFLKEWNPWMKFIRLRMRQGKINVQFAWRGTPFSLTLELPWKSHLVSPKSLSCYLQRQLQEKLSQRTIESKVRNYNIRLRFGQKQSELLPFDALLYAKNDWEGVSVPSVPFVHSCNGIRIDYNKLLGRLKVTQAKLKKWALKRLGLWYKNKKMNPKGILSFLSQHIQLQKSIQFQSFPTRWSMSFRIKSMERSLGVVRLTPKGWNVHFNRTQLLNVVQHYLRSIALKKVLHPYFVKTNQGYFLRIPGLLSAKIVPKGTYTGRATVECPSLHIQTASWNHHFPWIARLSQASICNRKLTLSFYRSSSSGGLSKKVLIAVPLRANRKLQAKSIFVEVLRQLLPEQVGLSTRWRQLRIRMKRIKEGSIQIEMNSFVGFPSFVLLMKLRPHTFRPSFKLKKESFERIAKHLEEKSRKLLARWKDKIQGLSSLEVKLRFQQFHSFPTRWKLQFVAMLGGLPLVKFILTEDGLNSQLQIQHIPKLLLKLPVWLVKLEKIANGWRLPLGTVGELRFVGPGFRSRTPQLWTGKTVQVMLYNSRNFGPIDIVSQQGHLIRDGSAVTGVKVEIRFRLNLRGVWRSSNIHTVTLKLERHRLSLAGFNIQKFVLQELRSELSTSINKQIRSLASIQWGAFQLKLEGVQVHAGWRWIFRCRASWGKIVRDRPFSIEVYGRKKAVFRPNPSTFIKKSILATLSRVFLNKVLGSLSGKYFRIDRIQELRSGRKLTGLKLVATVSRIAGINGSITFGLKINKDAKVWLKYPVGIAVPTRIYIPPFFELFKVGGKIRKDKKGKVFFDLNAGLTIESSMENLIRVDGKFLIHPKEQLIESTSTLTLFSFLELGEDKTTIKIKEKEFKHTVKVSDWIKRNLKLDFDATLKIRSERRNFALVDGATAFRLFGKELVDASFNGRFGKDNPQVKIKGKLNLLLGQIGTAVTISKNQKVELEAGGKIKLPWIGELLTVKIRATSNSAVFETKYGFLKFKVVFPGLGALDNPKNLAKMILKELKNSVKKGLKCFRKPKSCLPKDWEVCINCGNGSGSDDGEPGLPDPGNNNSGKGVASDGQPTQDDPGKESGKGQPQNQQNTQDKGSNEQTKTNESTQDKQGKELGDEQLDKGKPGQDHQQAKQPGQEGNTGNGSNQAQLDQGQQDKQQETSEDVGDKQFGQDNPEVDFNSSPIDFKFLKTLEVSSLDVLETLKSSKDAGKVDKSLSAKELMGSQGTEVVVVKSVLPPGNDICPGKDGWLNDCRTGLKLTRVPGNALILAASIDDEHGSAVYQLNNSLYIAHYDKTTKIGNVPYEATKESWGRALEEWNKKAFGWLLQLAKEITRSKQVRILAGETSVTIKIGNKTSFGGLPSVRRGSLPAVTLLWSKLENHKSGVFVLNRDTGEMYKAAKVPLTYSQRYQEMAPSEFDRLWGCLLSNSNQEGPLSSKGKFQLDGAIVSTVPGTNFRLSVQRFETSNSLLVKQYWFRWKRKQCILEPVDESKGTRVMCKKSDKPCRFIYKNGWVEWRTEYKPQGVRDKRIAKLPATADLLYLEAGSHSNGKGIVFLDQRYLDKKRYRLFVSYYDKKPIALTVDLPRNRFPKRKALEGLWLSALRRLASNSKRWTSLTGPVLELVRSGKQISLFREKTQQHLFVWNLSTGRLAKMAQAPSSRFLHSTQFVLLSRSLILFSKQHDLDGAQLRVEKQLYHILSITNFGNGVLYTFLPGKGPQSSHTSNLSKMEVKQFNRKRNE